MEGQQTVPQPTEEEVADFDRRLDEFRQSLPERDQKQLAALIVVAAREQEAGTQESSGDDTRPSEQEVDAFMDKLKQFHDSLPGDQHHLLDSLVRNAAAANEDVEGYDHQMLWWAWMPYSHRASYITQCYGEFGTLKWWTDRYGRVYRDRYGRYAVRCMSDLA
jgi:hypothetical protein